MADAITIKNPIGMSLYRFIYGCDLVLPLDVEFSTWAIHGWDIVRSTSDLLAYRAI